VFVCSSGKSLNCQKFYGPIKIAKKDRYTSLYNVATPTNKKAVQVKEDLIRSLFYIHWSPNICQINEPTDLEFTAISSGLSDGEQE
jgi:hypothetical protein